MQRFLYCHLGKNSLKSKFEDLLKCQTEAKWPFTTLPLPFGGPFNCCWLAGHFLVGNQIGDGQMLWQRVTGRLLN